MEQNIKTFNPSSNIAIVSLWTKKEEVIELLEKEHLINKINMIGTLYTAMGVNYLIKTIGKSSINKLIIIGNDLSDSAHFLLSVFTNDHASINKLMIREKELVNEFTKTIEIFDLRKTNLQLHNIIDQNYLPNSPEHDLHSRLKNHCDDNLIKLSTYLEYLVKLGEKTAKK